MATWEVFRRFSAQDARRAQRHSGAHFADDSMVDGTLPYGGGSANRVKATENQFLRAAKLGFILFGSYMIVQELHKAIVSPKEEPAPARPKGA